MSDLFKRRRIGMYEKAAPSQLSWRERLQTAKEIGFDYVEISVDETDRRLARLNWNKQKRRELRNLNFDLEMPLHSLCLSAHRRFPFGSHKPEIRTKAEEILKQGIEIAYDLGIRIIQLAGYDVYYEKASEQTRRRFVEGMQRSAAYAQSAGLMLGMEIMDTPYMNSVTKYLELEKQIRSPFFKVYPDLGNLSAWNENPAEELKKGIDHIVALHIKETLFVKGGSKGQFRDLIIGEGDVDHTSLFKTLKVLNYSGPFVIEMWAAEHRDYRKDLKTALNRVHESMDRAGV